MKKNLWLVSYDHRYGSTPYQVTSPTRPTVEDVVAGLGLSFEPDREVVIIYTRGTVDLDLYPVVVTERIALKVYQVTLAGYDSSTSDTDRLIKWVAAPNRAAVLAFCRESMWDAQNLELIDVPPTEDAGCDAILGEGY